MFQAGNGAVMYPMIMSHSPYPPSWQHSWTQGGVSPHPTLPPHWGTPQPTLQSGGLQRQVIIMPQQVHSPYMTGSQSAISLSQPGYQILRHEDYNSLHNWRGTFTEWHQPILSDVRTTEGHQPILRDISKYWGTSATTEGHLLILQLMMDISYNWVTSVSTND